VNHALALLALHAAVLLFGFAGLFGKWLALSPLLIVFAPHHRWRPRSSGWCGGDAGALPAVRVAAARQRGGPGAALGQLLRCHPGLRRGDRAVGLRELSTVRCCSSVRPGVRRGDGATRATALLVVVGLVLMVPGSRLANHGRRTAVGIVSGFTFALLAVINRRHAAHRPAADIAFWQNL
jgi:drug/metabolite transporter (DMT)-like permease